MEIEFTVTFNGHESWVEIEQLVDESGDVQEYQCHLIKGEKAHKIIEMCHEMLDMRYDESE